MSNLNQDRSPIEAALEEFHLNRVVPFDVPGHKRGKGNTELTAFLGQRCMSLDVNSMRPLDNLCHPVSVIKEGEELAAEAFGAGYAFFMVGYRQWCSPPVSEAISSYFPETYTEALLTPWY